MRVSIIGTGTIATAIVQNLGDASGDVLLGARNTDRAKAIASQVETRVETVSIPQAIEQGDILVFAVWLDVAEQLIKENHASLRGKIVVDPTNPIAPDGNGGFVKTIPADQSSGQLIEQLLPAEAALVKALGTLSADSLSQKAHASPQRYVGFYAADDKLAGFQASRLIDAVGFDPVLVGGLDQSARIEVFGDLHEFGAVGKPVDRSQAERLLRQAP